ncbi:membrane protein insertase YidC [Altererythrobacter xixiisoli]|uniref:Membrane protein insertase YidC n=1 Tax=Croceibacterium xixiisoli TaxID=1476466 RepID=A0A6I4TPM7_9SPHN|nr:membrane protein insertase YidC [Croceibacterium xixiisoli]MXO97842.1 membrane protein insertase YidC [Croceibacterium xixiisoli]
MNNQRNIIIFCVLSLLMVFGSNFLVEKFYPQPATPVRNAQAAAQDDQTPGAARHSRDGGLVDPIELAQEKRDLVTALATPGRIAIDAPEVAGSINPVGARIDDVVLKTHRETVEKDSGPVRIFSPDGTPAQQFAQFGWVGNNVALPTGQTVWQVEGSRLAPGQPVTLRWNNGQGLLFTIRYSIDEFYMMTVDQTVANTGTGAVSLQPYGFINRTSRTASTDSFNLHSGPIGDFDAKVNFDLDYDDVDETGVATPEGRMRWVGFTDIYWLSAMIPQANAQASGDFRALGHAAYRADMIYDAVNVGAGKQITRTTQLFVGAKESAVLDRYENAGVPRFGLAIDWGWFRWFMYPIFWLLNQLYALSGNFGVAIILLTVVVKALIFPIAQRGMASMAGMRAIQPKMKALQDRYKDDRVKLQQEMSKLYKEEKVNPLAGCLPMLLPIPIFFALYKTLLVAIEMRHKPFVLWIRDLSAPDPATILNLFGLLDFTPPSFLAIGVLALMLGVTMWLQFKLNPQAMDPVQQQMFTLMPWVLMFIMAPFAAGLLLYWITSNILTIAQQKYLYSRHPQLKAQMAKEREDKARAAAREKAKG